jgi:peptidoglycan/LPS O-acetylase OafA/YrhL
MTFRQTSTRAPFPRLAALDVLRAVAVFLVLGRHMPDAMAALAWPLQLWQRGGWIGVDLFFVLSGFLVSGLLFQEWERFGAIDYPRFLVRRSLKIHPPFYVLLLATWVIGHFLGKQIAPATLLSEAAFVQNYGPALFPHTWSLAVEEHFYLLLPVLLLGLGKLQAYSRDPLPVLGTVCLAGAATVLATRLISAECSMDGFHLKSHLFPTHLRIDSLLFGVLLSCAWQTRRTALTAWVLKWRALLVAIAAVLFAPAFAFPLRPGAETLLATLGLTGFYIASGITLLLALTSGGTLNAFTRGLAKIGRNSYSIYLWHIPVLFWVAEPVGNWLSLNAAQQLLTYLALSIGIGVALSKTIEVPFLALRDRWMPSRTAFASRSGTRQPQPRQLQLFPTA